MNTRIWFRRLSGIVLALGLVFFSSSALLAKNVLRLGHSVPTGKTDFDVAAVRFAERVGVHTKGRITIQVYGNAVLGKGNEILAQVKSGAIDLTVLPVSLFFILESKPKNFSIISSPYLFESREHFEKYLQSDLFQTMKTKVEKDSNVKVIGISGFRAPRGFSTTNKRVQSPDDLKGLKVSTQPSPTVLAAYKAWGANPTPLVAAETYAGLKSGLVEGRDLDLINLWSAGYYELQKYFIYTRWAQDGLTIIMNGDKWRSLSQSDQAAMETAVRETHDYVNAFMDDQLKLAETKLIRGGMEIIRPDLKPWMAVVEPLVRSMDGKQWEAGLYDKIKALQ